MIAWLLACGTPADHAAAPAAVEAPAPAAALPADLGLGRPATADEIAAWDLDVNPSWVGLPPGRGSVAEGKALFAARCVACHGVDAMSGPGFLGPRLVATEPLAGFQDDWHLPKAVGNYWPYTSTLFDYVRRSMPQNAPGSLTADETYAVVAYLLASNHEVPEDFVADQDSIKTAKAGTHLKFVPDDRLSTNTFR